MRKREKKCSAEGRVACSRELEQDTGLLMDTLAEADAAPVTFQLWDSCRICKAPWCSDELTSADRALWICFTH